MATPINEITALMKRQSFIRNISICAHIDHGKTSFSDNLMAGSGLMSKDLAGKVCALDFKDDEQERGITIDSAVVTLSFKVENEDYLVNLIDTPGHVDFGGDVTRALRAVDGTIVLVCAVEGVMPQTQTVVKQALREGVKPILFINKVDRLITELKLSSQEIQQRFEKIISEFNKLLVRYGADEWLVSVKDSTVIFGSSVHNWALSSDYIKKQSLSFKDVIDAYSVNFFESDKKGLSFLRERIPLYEVVINSVIKHLPNPVVAQRERIPIIWSGKQDSKLGVSLLKADPSGSLAMSVIKINTDKQGDIAIVRIYSGTLKKGSLLYLNNVFVREKAQQLFIWSGSRKVSVDDELVAGNIVGISGLRSVLPGETLSEEPMIPFNELKHLFDPVITKSLETKKPSDLSKLEEALKHLPKEDPSIKVEINKDTGEYLISGNGELHLEITENRLRNNKGIEVISGQPIVLFKEAISVVGQNDNSAVWFKASPIKQEELDSFKNKKAVVFFEDNILINSFQIINEHKSSQKLKLEKANDTIKQVFKILMRHGVLAGEQCSLVKVEVLGLDLESELDYSIILLEMKKALKTASPRILEPVQTMEIEVPPESIAEVTKIINSREAKIQSMYSGEYSSKIVFKISVENSFGLETALRSATAGKGSSFILNQEFLPVASDKELRLINSIRKRKGYRF